MEKTRNYNLKDFFANMGLAFKKLFGDDEFDNDVELTGELAKDPIESLKSSLLKSSDESSKSKTKSKTKSRQSMAKTASQDKSSSSKTSTKVHKTKSVKREPEEPSL